MAGDRAQLMTYISSGFPVIMALASLSGSSGHAICALGVKKGSVAPQTDPNLSYLDASTALAGVYAHDDRLGPYASIQMSGYTTPDGIRTGVSIEWPGQNIPADYSLLLALIVPVPTKLRLTAARMRALGHPVAEALARAFKGTHDGLTMNCRFDRNTHYLRKGYAFDLSSRGIHSLVCETVLSRYLGVIEITSPRGPFLDVLLDTTETRANPAVLACVRRGDLNQEAIEWLGTFTKLLGGRWIS